MSQSTILVLVGISLVSFVLSYVGASVGLVLGQVRVMLLVYVLGNVAVGTSTSLAISTCGTLAGIVPHLRGKRISFTLLLTVGIPSAVAAHVFARYATKADPHFVKMCIAATVLFAGVELLRGNKRDSTASGQRLEPRFSRPVSFGLEILVGVVLGAISGLVGLLLGSLRLPAMVRIARVEPSVAVGTNMAIGALTGIAGGFGATLHGDVDLTTFAIVTPLTLVGAHLGARKAGTVDRATLLRWMGYALVPTSLVMMLETQIRFPRNVKLDPHTATVDAATDASTTRVRAHDSPTFL